MSKAKKKKNIGKRLGAAVLALIVLLGGIQLYSNHHGKPKTDLKFVFVHGLSGWGSYDMLNTFFPYWGLFGGSVIKYLNRQGYDSYAASVNPTGSAWDRACELYAQLTGSVVDYGEEHSQRCHHERFGKDFSKKPLIKDFDQSRIVLLGHSFGGVTVRLFTELLRNGSEAERAEADGSDLSPFFKGGQEDRVFSVVTLAAPTNGTTAYDMYEDPAFDANAVEVPEKYVKAGGMVSKGTKAKEDGRIASDYAAYDMHIDQAYAINEQITTFDDIYYLAYPCSSCIIDENGNVTPDDSITEKMFMKSAITMSQYTGKTKGGITIGDEWRENDGLVNTISAKAPANAPAAAFTGKEDMVPGIWYEMPTSIGDHMYFQGGMTKHVKIKPFYLELAQMLADLA